MNIQTYLRLRPLEQKHKLKEEYFKVTQAKNLEEEKVSTGQQMKSSIVIHDPLKRSKDQYEFKFDRIFTHERSNAYMYKEGISRQVGQALDQGISQLIVSFGHMDSGKSYTLFGTNNFQLEKNLTDIDIDKSDDSRGLVLRCLHDIRKRDPQAQIAVSFIDLVMENVRDLLKYVKRDQKKQSAQHIGVNQLDDQRNGDFNLNTAQSIEKEFLEMHERPSERGQGTIFYLKNLTQMQGVADLGEAAYVIEKGCEMSEQLNKKLNYTTGIRYTRIFNVEVRSSKGKDSNILFVDLPDYEKLQTNIIDSQKLYESIVLNNTFNTLAKLVGGFNQGAFGVEDAPYQSSKLTRVLQSLLTGREGKEQKGFNITFLCCAWPLEAKYNEVISTLAFTDRIKKQSQSMAKSEYQGEMSTNQEKIMQEISKENMDIKFKIDSFKRIHQQKLATLKDSLGLAIPLDALLKTKGNQKEMQVVKEHKEAIDKTELYQKSNKDMEKKIEAVVSSIEEDVVVQREIQEQFSQKYYIIHKKIDKLREELKQSEMDLDNTMRGQINVRNEELQKVLNNTHAMLIENAGLVEQLNEEVIKKTSQGDPSQTKRINFMKDEGKREAEDQYMKLLQGQEKEFQSQIQKTKQTMEHLLRKKEEDIKKASDEFKRFHDKIKNDQRTARNEIVKLYNIAKKQNTVLSNIENGVYSQTAKKLKLNDQQKPCLPDPSRFEFLFEALERHSKRGSMTQAQNTMLSGNYQSLPHGSIIAEQKQKDEVQSLVSKNVDSVLNPDDMRVYVKQLMEELAKHSQSHPQILKGESVETVMKEVELNKKAYENASKKNNDIRIQIEAQRRLIERIQIERVQVPGQPLIR